MREFRKDYGGDEIKLCFLSNSLGWFHLVSPGWHPQTSHMSATLHSQTHSQQSFFPRMDVKTAVCTRQIPFTFLHVSNRIKSHMIAQPRAYSLWKDMCSNRQIRLSFLMMLSGRWRSHWERVLKDSFRVVPVMNGDRPLFCPTWKLQWYMLCAESRNG